MCTIYIITIPKRTNRARLVTYKNHRTYSVVISFRSILFTSMLIYVILERYYQMSSINFYQWRCVSWICCLLILVYYAYKYRSRKEIHHEQLNRITASLIETEATFHRVSRELKRARSKSRSRSRSIRSRRREEQQLKSPRIFTFNLNQ